GGLGSLSSPAHPLLPHRGLVVSGNLIGKTVKIDFNMQRAERGKFARITVEIDLSEPLPPVVMLDGATQLLEYENIPTLCFSCRMIGHDLRLCPLAAPLTGY
ncbi:hypothetical protein LINPERHAP1_LOCUS22606, partial [Linum perenne]